MSELQALKICAVCWLTAAEHDGEQETVHAFNKHAFEPSEEWG